MGAAFYIIMGVLGGLCAINLYTVGKQEKSRIRTFSLWLNGLALVLIVAAIVIALFK